ncbi:glycosyltransferase family 4 protein [Niabella soli]|uniref:Glycosyl transferase family 1 n=1 Tax=Niabella soli DSM 19437 TaxID=929713 RepID=W0F631_9BACT|nr:glycosyltransferase family 4 protein [Niabella soli]AHF16919.1 glycosyl transferase family 1 [Niabella soli DSM 19437]
MKQHYHLSIVSCCIDDWGGSEELWARSIPLLQKSNCRFTLYKERINSGHPEIKKLAALGVHFTELNPPRSIVSRAARKIRASTAALRSRSPGNLITSSVLPVRFRKHLKAERPDLVIVAQGINFDGLEFAFECMQLRIPYVIITQKGVDFYWPPPASRSAMRSTLLAAKQCYFVSRHNQQLTEEQFSIRLSNATLVSNPVKLIREPLPFPPADKTYRLACVGRLFIIDKGQDILLRILSREPWRSRNIEVSFIGRGTDEEAIRELAQFLDVPHTAFHGYSEDISAIWQTHHALLLPSRSEGMALSVLEAMAAGRVAIVTNAGGHGEIIDHGTNGFISDATETAFEQNMEQAWQQRHAWKAIGENAAAYIHDHIPQSPETEFSLSILKQLHDI